MIKIRLTDCEEIDIITYVPVLPEVNSFIWVDDIHCQVLSITFEFTLEGFKYIEVCISIIEYLRIQTKNYEKKIQM